MVCLHVPLALSSAFSFLRCHSPTLLALVPIFFPSFFSLHHILIPPAAFLLLSSAVLAKKAFPSSNFVRAILTLPSYSVSCPLFPRICDRLLVKQPVSSPARSFRGAPGKWAAVDTTTKTNMHSHTVTPARPPSLSAPQRLWNEGETFLSVWKWNRPRKQNNRVCWDMRALRTLCINV